MSRATAAKEFGKRILATLKSLAVLIIIGFTLVLVGPLLHELQNPFLEEFGTLLSELGFAFLVAVVLFLAFEEWAAREHKKSAIAHIYGMKPDEKVFDMIEKHILKQRFYRSRLVITYAFKQPVGENILIEQSAKYLVTNVCSRYDTSEFEIKGNIELRPLNAGDAALDADLGLKTLTLFRKCDGKLVPEVIPDAEIERTPNADTCTEGFRLKRKIRLRFEESIRVELVSNVIRRNHDAAVWMSTVPSTGLEFGVTWDEPIRLKFAFHATHPELGILKPKPGPRSLVIKLGKPFLKGHGIHFRWSPDTTAGDAAPPLPAPQSA